MRNYDYLHQGLTDGLAATPANTYKVIKTDKNIDGQYVGWLATSTTIKKGKKTYRWFVNVNTGLLLAFDEGDVFQQVFNA